MKKIIQKEMQTTNKHMKRYSTLLVIKEMQIKDNKEKPIRLTY